MEELLLHPAVQAKLAPQQFQLGLTYVFFGQAGQGKRAAARELARLANCTGDDGRPCASCRQIALGVHADLITLEPDGNSIGIDQVRALHQVLSLGTGERRTQRFVLIDEADQLTLEAQNALLKTIEEPPPATTIILLARQLEGLLTTVQSRARSLYFPPIEEAVLAQFLAKRGLKDDVAVGLAAGAPGLALRLVEDRQLQEQYQNLNQAASQILSGPIFGRLLTIKELPSDGSSLAILLDRLIAQARQLARGPSTGALLAVERLAVQLRGGVSSRPALEAMALSVP